MRRVRFLGVPEMMDVLRTTVASPGGRVVEIDLRLAKMLIEIIDAPAHFALDRTADVFDDRVDLK